MQVLWPDDSAMPAGVVTVPQGVGVLLKFSGSYGGSASIAAGDSISILGSSKSCQSGADFADAASADLTAVILDNTARAFFDFSLSRPQTGYQICVCPVASQSVDVNGKLVCSNGAAFKDATTITVQDALVSFIFKGMQAAHFTIPIENCGSKCTRVQSVNMVYRSGPLVTKGSSPSRMSIIPVAMDCTDARENLQVPGVQNSGFLRLDDSTQRQIFGIEYITRMAGGTYKVCQKPDTQALFNWRETGITLVLQNRALGIKVNGVFGYVASTPNVQGVPIQICGNLNCSRPWAAADRISFVPVHSDCTDEVVANPPSAGTGVSGHLSLSATGQIAQTDLDPVLESSLAVGDYVMCYKIGSTGFQRSGLILQVQDQVLGLEVNEVMPNNGLRVSVPQSPGTAMRYISRSGSGVAGDSFAFIAFESECADLCLTVQIQACNPAVATQFAPSGFLSAHSDDKLLGNSSCFGNHEDFDFSCSPFGEGNRGADFSSMQSGRYKTCFRAASLCAFQTCWPVWSGTGIVLEVQAHATAFLLNYAGGAENTAHGQRLVAPKMNFHKLAFIGASSGEIAFQQRQLDCQESAVAMVQGVTAPQQEFDQAQIDAAFGVGGLLSLEPYQVCFKPQGAVAFINTGVSLKLQDYINGLDVNSVRANGGVRTSLAIQTSSRVTFFRSSEPTPGDSVSLIPFNMDCNKPAQNPPASGLHNSGHFNLTAVSVYGGSILLLNGSDSVSNMAPGWYKVCFRENATKHIPVTLESSFLETGLTVRLQNDLVSLRVNTRFEHRRLMGSNRGVRVALPKTTGNKLVASHSGTLAFIRIEGDCSDLTNDNPPLDADRRPQWLDLDSTTFDATRQSMDVLLSGGKSGLLQVCHRLNPGARFESTGLSLTIQDTVTGLVVNTITPNFGLRVAMPRREGNVAFYQSNSAQSNSVSGTLSLIDIFGDCTLPSDNPQSSNSALNASGPITTSNFVLQDLSVIAELDSGEYQVCFMGAQDTVPMATGLTLMVQGDVLAMQVNRVNKVSSATPRAPESEISYCRDILCQLNGYPAAAISFIQGFQECEDERLQNPAIGASGRSGHFDYDNGTRTLSFAATTRILSEEGTLASGTYQVCFTSGGPFLSTGLSLNVQERILGLEVNRVNPNYGLRVAIPKVSAITVELVYISPFLGRNGDSISFISLTGDCSSLVDNPPAQAAGVSGHIAADGVTKVFTGTQVIAALDGQYQVCFRSENGDFETTGLSATVQSIATGFDIGGTKSLNAVLEKGAAQSESSLSISGPQADATASLILPSKSCANIEDNPVDPSAAASGHMAVLYNSGSSLGEVQLNYDALDHPGLIQELTYQLCITAEGVWRSTGISVRVRWKCLTAGVDGVFKTLQVDESSNIAGAMNAVHVIMETEPRLPPGSVLRVEGLQGSLTEDNALLDVFGNSIRTETITFPCQGNGSCVLDLENYSPQGTIIFSASLSIELVCTDFDSCGESIEKVVLSSDVRTEDLTELIDPGPWGGCIADCGKTVRLLGDFNVIEIAGKRGKPMQVQITANRETNYHACSGYTLFAQVSLTLQYSILSTHSFFGSWTKSRGILAVAFVPFEDSEFIHITFVLRNPTRPNIPRPRPVVSLCAIQTGAGQVPATTTTTLLAEKDNVLKADLAPQFASAEIVESSNLVNARNRISVKLRTNLPFLLPKGLSITIAGLTGTQTTDTSQLRLLDPAYVTQVPYVCSGARSCTVSLDTRASAGTLFHRATLDVSLFCTDFRSYPTKFIQEIRTCTKAPGANACPNQGSFPFPADSYSRGPWQECDACRESTRPVMRSYDLADVIATYGPEFNLEIVASQGVGDMKCYKSVEVQSVRADIILSIEYARSSGIWANQDGELVVTGEALAAAMTCTSSGDLSCFPQVTYSFEVQNSATEQPAVIPRLSAMGAGYIFPAQTLQPKLAASFRQSYALTRTSIGQTTRKKGEVGTTVGLNTLTVSFTAEAPIPAGTRVTITGLTGTQTESELCQEVVAPRCGAPAVPPQCLFQSVATAPCRYGMQLLGEDLGTDLAGSWDKASGTLIFVVQSSFQAMRTITVSFKVYNKLEAQPPVTAMISATNPNGFQILSTQLEGEVLQSDEDNIPVEAISPQVLSSIVVEDVKKEYQNNTIMLSVLPNLPLSQGSLVTIQGFKTSLMEPSMGRTWFSDALPNVETIAVAGSHVAPSATWQDSVSLNSGWVCQGGSWYTSVDAFDGRLILFEQNWCSVQPPYSVVARLDTCVRAAEDLNFSFRIRNNEIPPTVPDPPSLDIQSGSAKLPQTNLRNIIYYDSRVRLCSGSFSCMLSIMHTSSYDCFEDSCRILPPMARLLNASIDVDLACANFERRGQFVDRITACEVPNCARDYDNLHTWDVQSNACCVNGRNCQKYDCLVPVASFETGPWKGCSGNCSDSRRVVRSYNLMELLCNDPNNCYDPVSFVFYMSISSAADIHSCSGPGTETYTQAQVTLNVQYQYGSVGFASEIARLDVFDVITSNDVQGAETEVTVRLQAQSPLSPGSTVNISGLLGTQSMDFDSILIENLDCDGVEDRFCTQRTSNIVATTGGWRRAAGTVQTTVVSFVPLGQMFSFRFRLVHSATAQDGLRPSALIYSISTGQLISQQSESVVLAASEPPAILPGVVSQGNSLQRQDNRISVAFRSNINLRKGDVITVSGLRGTPTRSGDLTATFEGTGGSVVGQWDRASQRFVLQLPIDHLPLEVVAFEFTLRNGGGPQAGTGIRVAVSPQAGTTGSLVGTLFGQALTATEAPLFERSRIYEAVQVFGQMNQLEVTFQSSVVLPFGSLLVIDHLYGVESPSSEVHPITFQSSVCNEPREMVGNWDQGSSKLSMYLPITVSTQDLVTISFRLMNPSQPQTPTDVKLSAISPFGVLAFNSIGRAFGAAAEASFQIAEIGQSARVGGQTSDVTLMLKTNINIVPGMQMAITGLSGLTVSTIDLLGPSSSSFLSPAPYVPATGLITLFPLVPINYEDGGSPLVLRWSQQVPNSGSNVVNIQLFQDTATVIQRTSLRGSAVSTNLGRITRAEIQESSTVKFAPNSLAVTLEFDVPISFGAVITLTGMTSSLTPDETALEVVGQSSYLFGNKGKWTQSSGSLELTVEDEVVVPAGESMSFAFVIDNPSSANPSGTEVSVQAQALLAGSGALSPRVMFASDDPRFESASIEEGNSVRTMTSEMRVTAVPNSPLFDGTSIQIKPLTGATFNPNPTVTWTDGTQTISEMGTWDAQQEQISFQLSARVEARSTFVVSFDVINPSSRQSAVIVTLSASGTDTFGVPTNIELELAGSVLSSAESPGFHYTNLQESSKLAGGPNTISMNLISNAVLEIGATIRIFNLIGSGTVSGRIQIDEEVEEIGGPPGPSEPPLPFGGRKLNITGGSFNQGSGVLEVGVVARVPEDYSLKFSFVLLNSPVAQTPVLPEVLVEYPKGRVFIARTAVASDDVVWSDGIERWRGDVPPEFVNGQIMSASDGYFFTRATVREQNAVAGQPNTLYFSFLANSNLYPGALVTVTGLKGSGSSQLTTSTDAAITIGQLSGVVQGRFWTPITGVLIVEVMDLILLGSELAFSFPVRNPAAPQNPVLPVITVNMVNPFTTLGIMIPPFPISAASGQKCCLSADDLPTFLSATVRESTSVKSQDNVLYFTLRSSIPLQINTEITISNLLGSATFDTADLVISNSSSLRANWRQNTGTLRFVLDASMYVCDCVEFCQQNNLEFSVQLRNSDRQQAGGVARVSASRGGLNSVRLESAFVTGEVLRAQDNPFFISSIYEASNVTAQLNTITVSLKANFALQVCRAQWTAGTPGWLDTANSVLDTDGAPIDDTKLFDGTVQTFVQFPQNAGVTQYLVFDMKEVFRMEAIRIISYSDGSGVKSVMWQYGDSATGPWYNAMSTTSKWNQEVPDPTQASGFRTITTDFLETGIEFQRSDRFPTIASQYWRLSMFANQNPVVYVRTIISDISFFGCPDRGTHGVVLSNLTGTQTIDNPQMKILESRSQYGRIRPNATWNQAEGSLRVKMDGDVKAFDELGFTFQVQNAAAAQALRKINVEVFDGPSNVLLPPPIQAVGEILSSNEESIFAVRDISESSQFQSDVNTLHIVLEANVPLRGSESTTFRVVFSAQYFAEMQPLVDKTQSQFLCAQEVRQNLPCFTGFTVPPRQGNFEVLFRSSGATDIDPQYADTEPSVVVKLDPGTVLPEGTRIELDILVVNPARRQNRGFSPSVEGSLLSRRRMFGEVMQAAVVGLVFSTRNLAETSKMALAQNILTATLVPGTNLVPGTSITISGLVGTTHPTGTAFPFLSQAPSGVLRNAYQWSENRLIVRVGDAVWPKDTQVVLSWQVANGETRSRFERVQIVGDEGITIATDMCKSMDPTFPGQCLQFTDVLNIDRVPGVVNAEIKQDNPVQGQQNLITVSLLPNVEVLAGSRITITGLTGTATADGLLSGLSGQVAHLLRTVSWVQATGDLVLESRDSLNSASSPDFSFSFYVTNALSQQATATPRYCMSFSFASTGICGGAICDVLGASSLNVDPQSTNCTGKALLSVDDPGFLSSSGAVRLLVNEISESSNVPNQDSVITVRLASSVVIRPGVKISVHGLVNSQTSDSTQIPVLVSNQECENSGSWSQAPFCPASWKQQQGMLVFTVGNAVTATTEVLTLVFVIRNPATAQSTYAAAKVTADLGTAARFNAARLMGNILKADGTARILNADVQESTTVHQQKNYLSFTFTSNVPLSQGSVATISGLYGHDISDWVQCNQATQAKQLVAELPPVEVVFGDSQAQHAVMSSSFKAFVDIPGCQLATSTLTVALPRGYAQEENIVFRFPVFNKMQGSNGTTPKVSVSGCRAGLLPSFDQFCSHTRFTAPSGGSTCTPQQQLQMIGSCSVACPQCSDNSICAPCSTGTGDFVDIPKTPTTSKVLGAGTGQRFLVNTVGESTNAVSLMNTLTVSLQMNVALEPGSIIRLRGFNKSQTESSELLLFGTMDDRRSFQAFGVNGTAMWDAMAGELTMQTRVHVPTAQLMVIAFEILNPGQQISAICLNGRNFCEENNRIFSGTGLNKGRECPVAGGVCAGECKFRNAFCSNNNALNCTGTSAACKICISPNNNALCPSTAMASLNTAPKSALQIPADAPNVAVECFPTATACNRQTRCLAPNTGQECDQHVQCTGPYDPTIPETDWVRRLGPQRCVRLVERAFIYSDVLGTRVDIPQAIMDGVVLGFSSPQPPAFLTKTITQSSRVPGELNMLTVSLNSNFPLSDMETTLITISGFPSDLNVKMNSFRAGPKAGTQFVPLFQAGTLPSKPVRTTCILLEDEDGEDGGPPPDVPPSGNSSSLQRRSAHQGETGEPVRYRCTGIAANLSSNVLYTSALLNLRVECPLNPSSACPACAEDYTAETQKACFLIQDVSIRNLRTGQEVPAGIGSFRSSPCLGSSSKCEVREVTSTIPARPGFPERQEKRNASLCMVLDRLDVLSFVESADSKGFAIELVSTTNGLDILEAELLVTSTDSFAHWEQTTSSAQLVVNGGEAPLALVPAGQGRTFEFGFQVQNFEFPITAPVLTVVGSSGLVKDAGLCIDEIDAGCELFRKDLPPVPSTVRTLVSGQILQSDRAQTLAIATIKETSGLAGTVNALTIELNSNTDATIPPGTRISIIGLIGSLTPDSNNLPVVGTGVVPTATWMQSTGTLVVRLLTEYGSFESPLLISFEILNPPRRQAPVKPQITMSGPKIYGPQELRCITAPGCTGVLSASTIADFTRIELAENNRYAGELNFVTWFISTTIPIHRNDVRIVIEGLNVSAGSRDLARNPGEVQYARECEGLKSCVIELPSRTSPGTIRTLASLDVWLSCDGLLLLKELFVCGVLIPLELILATQCLDPTTADIEVVQRYDVSDCSRQDVAVLAQGEGTMKLRGLLTMHYQFDVTSGTAVWDEVLGMLTVQVVRNTTAQSPTLLDPMSFAFSLGFYNPPTLRAANNITLTIVWDDDNIAINRSVKAEVLQSGVQRCTGVAVLNASGVYPGTGPATTSIAYPPNGLTLYNEPNEEGEESCLILVQPTRNNQTQDWLLKIELHRFDINEDLDSLTVFEGDSPEALEIARVYYSNRGNPNDPRYYYAQRALWSQACTTSLQMRVTRKASPSEPFFGSVTSGDSGFSLKYSLVDPTKMDHLRANISLTDLLGPLTDEWSLLRLRKILAATNQVMYTFVILEKVSASSATSGAAGGMSGAAGGMNGGANGNQTARRLLQTEQLLENGGRQSRRLLQTTSMVLETRMLANSPAETVEFAKGLTQALFSRAVTNAMNNQGIVGSASLIGSVSVFRCGFELECVPTPPITPAPEIVIPIITTTPEPFPLQELIQLGGALVIGPTLAGFCCCLGLMYYKFRDWRDNKRKTATAIEHWTTYFGKRRKELLKMDIYSKEAEAKGVYGAEFGNVFGEELTKEKFEERVDELIKKHFKKHATNSKWKDWFKETKDFLPFEYADLKYLPKAEYEAEDDQTAVEDDKTVEVEAKYMKGDVVTTHGNGNGMDANGINEKEDGVRSNGLVNGNGKLSGSDGDRSMEGDIMDENEPDADGRQAESEDEDDGGKGGGVGTEEVHLAV